MARSGSEFASLPLSIRTAIITADLVIRADLDAAEARRQQEIDSNHAAFVKEFDAWVILDDQLTTAEATEATTTMDIPDLD